MSRALSVLAAASLLVCCVDAQIPSSSACAGSACADAERGSPAAERPVLAATATSSDIIPEPADDAAVVFDQAKVLTYDLTISPLDLALINARPSAEQYVPATLKVMGETLRVAVRYKGDVGAFLAPCTAQTVPGVGKPLLPKVGKCSFKIAFDEYDEEARFHGLKKLNLHAMGHDPSLMKERLGYALFREMGVAAPRAVHARVTINGRLEGIFAAVEEIDGRFARSRFRDGGKGNVYKEVWPTDADADDFREALESNKDEGNVAKMVTFGRAIRENPTRAAATWIDRQYMVAYLAVDRAILNDDGFLHWYCFVNHNYFWYEAVNANRMSLIPWDLDDAFQTDGAVALQTAWNAPAATCGACGAGDEGFGDFLNSLRDFSAQRPPTCDPLTEEFARWKADYEGAIDRLMKGPFAASNINAKLDAWSKQIEPLVVEATGVLGADSRSSWQRKLNELRFTIDQLRALRGRI